MKPTIITQSTGNRSLLLESMETIARTRKAYWRAFWRILGVCLLCLVALPSIVLIFLAFFD